MPWRQPGTRATRPEQLSAGERGEAIQQTGDNGLEFMTVEQQASPRKIAFLVAAEGIEQVEFTQPWEALKAAGWQPELISPETGRVQAYNHLDKGDTFQIGRAHV